MAFAFQGTRALWEPDEGRYTAVALQMLDSGDYALPRLNDDQPHLTKPPITYWMVAGSVAAFGTSTWAARLPFSICFVLTAFAVHRLARRYVPERPWLPTLLWSTSLLPLIAANVVSTDTPLALFETLALLAFVSSQPGNTIRVSPAVCRLLMWLAFALGFMTKGPPALLPLLPIVTWTVATQGRRAARSLFPVSGCLVFLVVGGAWYGWLFARQPELIGYFFGYELFDRLFTGVHRRNSEWYGALKIYGPVLVLCAMPWLLLMRRWPAALARSFSRGTWHRRLSRDPDGAFLMLWLLMPLAVFLLARSRLFLYVLPLAVPIALLMGRELSRAVGERIPAGWRSALTIWPLIAVIVKASVMHLPTHKDDRVEAARLASRLQGADRIVYVGERARYGLRFYTGLPVIQFEATAAAGALPEQTADVLCLAATYSPHALLIGGRKRIASTPACMGQALVQVGPDEWRVGQETRDIHPTRFTAAQEIVRWTEAHTP